MPCCPVDTQRNSSCAAAWFDVLLDPIWGLFGRPSFDRDNYETLELVEARLLHNLVKKMPCSASWSRPFARWVSPNCDRIANRAFAVMIGANKVIVIPGYHWPTWWQISDSGWSCPLLFSVLVGGSTKAILKKCKRVWLLKGLRRGLRSYKYRLQKAQEMEYLHALCPNNLVLDKDNIDASTQ